MRMLSTIIAAEHCGDHCVDIHCVREPVSYFLVREDGVGLVQPPARCRLRIVRVKPDLVDIDVVEIFAFEFVVPEFRQYAAEGIEFALKKVLQSDVYVPDHPDAYSLGIKTMPVVLEVVSPPVFFTGEFDVLTLLYS